MARDQLEKRHAACDECRTRKLKCSGEYPRCSRCEKEGTSCFYSPQRQMGRPRKRRREDQEQAPQQPADSNGFSSMSGSTPSGLMGDYELGISSDLSDLPTFSTCQPDGMAFNSMVSHDDTALENFEPDALLSLNSEANPIDPSLWDLGSAPANDTNQPSSEDSSNITCSCLSTSYLTLTDLQSITSFAFPAVIPRLRAGINTTLAIVYCDKCPKDNFLAIQNVMAVSSLLTALAERFHKVLHAIEEETARLEANGEKKPFRMGDNSPEHMHLHTGTLDCPMGFNIELEPQQWRTITKKIVKTEVLGQGSNPNPLINVVSQMEQRQHQWHTIQGTERRRIFGACKPMVEAAAPQEAPCLKMAHQVRVMIENMNFE